MIWTFRNSTTVLIIFMTISNLIFTAIVLPLNSIAIMWPQWVFDFFTQFVLPEVFWSVSSNVRYIQDRPFCCASFAFLFYWSFATLLFMEAALAVNRWAAVCTHNLRFSFCRLFLMPLDLWHEISTMISPWDNQIILGWHFDFNDINDDITMR